MTLTLKGTAAKLLSSRRTFKAKLALTPSGAKKATITKTVALKAVIAKKKTPVKKK